MRVADFIEKNRTYVIPLDNLENNVYIFDMDGVIIPVKNLWIDYTTGDTLIMVSIDRKEDYSVLLVNDYATVIMKNDYIDQYYYGMEYSFIELRNYILVTKGSNDKPPITYTVEYTISSYIDGVIESSITLKTDIDRVSFSSTMLLNEEFQEISRGFSTMYAFGKKTNDGVNFIASGRFVTDSNGGIMVGHTDSILTAKHYLSAANCFRFNIRLLANIYKNYHDINDWVAMIKEYQLYSYTRSNGIQLYNKSLTIDKDDVISFLAGNIIKRTIRMKYQHGVEQVAKNPDVWLVVCDNPSLGWGRYEFVDPTSSEYTIRLLANDLSDKFIPVSTLLTIVDTLCGIVEEP